MKYKSLRNKKVGDKDLELKTPYRKKRLYEIQEQESEKELHEDTDVDQTDDTGNT